MCATALTAARHAASVLTRVSLLVVAKCFSKTCRRIFYWCRRDCVRPHKIDSRPVVSIYRELQHGPGENVRKNPARPSGRRGKGSAGDRGRARQGFVDRQKDGDRPVMKRVLRFGFRWQLRRLRTGMTDPRTEEHDKRVQQEESHWRSVPVHNGKWPAIWRFRPIRIRVDVAFH